MSLRLMPGQHSAWRAPHVRLSLMAHTCRFVGLVFALHFAYFLFIWEPFAAGAIRTEAIVVDLQYYQADDRTHPLLRFRFDDQQGREHVVRRRVHSTDFAAGDRITVAYQPHDPKLVSLADPGVGLRHAVVLAAVGGGVLVCLLAGMIVRARPYGTRSRVDKRTDRS